MAYEALLREAAEESIEVFEKPMSKNIKGMYSDNVIWLNSKIKTLAEKNCVLAEEIGHYYTSTGNILDQTKVENRKQEKRARNWGYEKLVPLDKLIEVHKAGIKNRYELAELLDITEELLEKAIKHYNEKYGILVEYKDCIIYFEPLMILRRITD